MIPNLLPRDTRAAEIASAVAMLLAAIWLATTGGGARQQLAHPIFWAVILSVTGAMQLASLLRHPDLESLRATTALMNGAWWVWLGLAGAGVHTNPGDWAALALGVANLYGFTVATVYLHARWQK